MDRQRHGIELVNDFESWLFTKIIHDRDIEEIIERELVSAEFRNLTEIAGENRESGFPSELNLLPDLRTQQLPERREKFRPGHAMTPSSLRIHSRFCSRN